MAIANWKIIYRDYNSQELKTESDNLKKEAGNLYLAQSVGGKSYQRSITSVEERLRALAEIRREKSGNSYNTETYTDFGGYGLDGESFNRNMEG